MPTKPTDTYTFATDAVFGSGPAAGFPTRIPPPSLLQGFIPGTGVAGEHVNYLFNIDGQWINDWLLLGTSDPDEDAHIVETDSDGLISATRIDAGGSTIAGTPSANFTSPASGNANVVSIATTGASTGRALSISHAATGGGDAVLVSASEGAGAVMSVSSSVNNSGVALEIAAQGASSDRGITVFTLSGNPGPLRLFGRDEPPAPALGDIYIDNTVNFQRLRVHHSSAFQTVWTTPSGFARAYDEDLTQSSQAAGGFTSKVSITIPASAGLQNGAVLHLRGVVEVGTNIATTVTNMVGLEDLTAPATIATRSKTTFHAAGAATETYIVITADYTLPASGARTFSLSFQGNGAQTTFVRNATLEITGQY